MKKKWVLTLKNQDTLSYSVPQCEYKNVVFLGIAMRGCVKIDTPSFQKSFISWARRKPKRKK